MCVKLVTKHMNFLYVNEYILLPQIYNSYVMYMIDFVDIQRTTHILQICPHMFVNSLAEFITASS